MHCRKGTPLYDAAAEATKNGTIPKQLRHNPCYDDPNLRIRVQVNKVLDLAQKKVKHFQALASQWGLGENADPRVGGMFSGAGFPVLCLPYETLRTNTSLWNEAAALLGLTAVPGSDVFAPDPTVKRVRRTHREIIANYDEVEAALRKANLGWLLEDL